MSIARRKPLKRGKPPKRGGKPKAVNYARRKKNWTRAYGSKERVEWVKRQRCVHCLVLGYSENAHAVSGGKGRKADYTTIIPLCGPRPYGYSRTGSSLYEGCHRRYDKREISLDGNALIFAADIEAQWQSYLQLRGSFAPPSVSPLSRRTD